jgi:hypothetical protein
VLAQRAGCRSGEVFAGLKAVSWVFSQSRCDDIV